MVINITIQNGEIISHEGFYWDNNDLVCEKSFLDKSLTITYEELCAKANEEVEDNENVEFWEKQGVFYIKNVKDLTDKEIVEAFNVLVNAYRVLNAYVTTNIKLVAEI